VAGRAAGVGDDAVQAAHDLAAGDVLDPDPLAGVPLGEELAHAADVVGIGRDRAAAEQVALPAEQAQADRRVGEDQVVEDVRVAAAAGRHEERHLAHRQLQALAGGLRAGVGVRVLEQLEGAK